MARCRRARPALRCAIGLVRPMTWCGSRPPARYEWTGRPDFGPTIVDLDNLEDIKAELRAELLADQLHVGGRPALSADSAGVVPGQTQRQRLASVPALGGGDRWSGS